MSFIEFVPREISTLTPLQMSRVGFRGRIVKRDEDNQRLMVIFTDGLTTWVNIADCRYLRSIISNGVEVSGEPMSEPTPQYVASLIREIKVNSLPNKKPVNSSTFSIKDKLVIEETKEPIELTKNSFSIDEKINVTEVPKKKKDIKKSK